MIFYNTILRILPTPLEYLITQVEIEKEAFLKVSNCNLGGKRERNFFTRGLIVQDE